jgi:hypothetical protein
MAPHNITPIDAQTYHFNAAELARLAVYRAAVAARFYTDQCEPSPRRAGVDIVRLLDAAQAA